MQANSVSARAQTSVTKIDTEICHTFLKYPVMREVGKSLFKRALTPLRLRRARPQMQAHSVSARTQRSVTKMGTEICPTFLKHLVMRKVGEPLSKRALTSLRLRATMARVARAPFAARRAC